MDLFLTVATGYVGSGIAQALQQAGVETILTALANSHKPFIYTSGSWVLGSLPQGLVADEEQPPAPPLIVAWRQALEQRIRAASEYGVHAIVLRPWPVYGHGGGIPGMLVHFARQEGVAHTIGNGENVWTVVHRDDLANAYVRALTLAPAGTILNIVSEPAVSVRAMAQATHIAVVSIVRSKSGRSRRPDRCLVLSWMPCCSISRSVGPEPAPSSSGRRKLHPSLRNWSMVPTALKAARPMGDDPKGPDFARRVKSAMFVFCGR